jgi:hypothetical protein
MSKRKELIDNASKRLSVEMLASVVRALNRLGGFDGYEKAAIASSVMLSVHVSLLRHCGWDEQTIAGILRESADRVERGPDEQFPVAVAPGKEGDPS